MSPESPTTWMPVDAGILDDMGGSAHPQQRVFRSEWRVHDEWSGCVITRTRERNGSRQFRMAAKHAMRLCEDVPSDRQPDPTSTLS
jgi:hypothetical protein